MKKPKVDKTGYKFRIYFEDRSALCLKLLFKKISAESAEVRY